MTDEELELFPTSESASRMLSSVTQDFYEKSYVGKWIFQVMGLEYDDMQTIVEELPDQFFPETATWGLKYHEMKWGLAVRENLSYEERRQLIYQKRDCRAPMTPYRMERYLEMATGLEVRVVDANDSGDYGFEAAHPNIFKVYFIDDGDGGTLDTAAVFALIDKLKQSHTTYSVNERTEITLDNSNLEEFILQNIHFKMGVPFWYDHVFDGSWLLDGSITLGEKRRYGLRLGLKYNYGGFDTKEQIKLLSAKFATHMRNNELFNAGTGYRFGINFWGANLLDGTWNLDGSILLDAYRRYGVVIGTKYMLDGAQLQEKLMLNSIAFKWMQEHSFEIASAVMLSSAAERSNSIGAAFAAKAVCDGSGLETVENITIETRSRDYWLMDGTYVLDGSRSLDSIYGKEVAE